MPPKELMESNGVETYFKIGEYDFLEFTSPNGKKELYLIPNENNKNLLERRN